MSLETKLLSLGMSEKETAVYMAMLYLGTATAQDIAIRSGVNRATTYVMLEALINKGVASQVTKDQKTYFSAEDPLQLLRVLEAKKADIEEAMGNARMVIPQLQELYQLNKTKVNVRLIEGKESIRIIQNDIARCKSKAFDTILHWNYEESQAPVEDNDHRSIFNEKKFKIRSIFTYDATKPIPHMPFFKGEERRMIPQGQFPVFAEIILYDNKIAMLNNTEKVFGVIIEDQMLHDTFKTMFNLSWEAAEKFSLKK